MKQALLALRHDDALATDVRNAGLAIIGQRHTCRHRAIELLQIANSLRETRASVSTQVQQEARP